jgi:hypothetical protein
MRSTHLSPKGHRGEVRLLLEGFQMLNKNQRQFRKEMKKVQKAAEKNKNSPYYSYVQDEVITDYYAGPAKTKRRSGGFIGRTIRFLLTFIVIGFIFIGVVRFLHSSSQLQNLNQVQTIKEFSLEQKALYDYISKVSNTQTEVSTIMKYAVNELPKTAKRDTTYESNLKKYLDRLRNIVGEMSLGNVPSTAEKLNELEIQLLTVQHEQLTYLLSSVENKNPALREQYNILNEKVNLLGTQIQSETIRALKASGMNYQIKEDGVIEYGMIR